MPKIIIEFDDAINDFDIDGMIEDFEQKPWCKRIYRDSKCNECNNSKPSLDVVVRLTDTIKKRELYKQKVKDEVSQNTLKGRLVTMGQMPSWGEYENARDKVLELEIELIG